jgi:hypothetical protein
VLWGVDAGCSSDFLIVGHARHGCAHHRATMRKCPAKSTHSCWRWESVFAL